MRKDGELEDFLAHALGRGIDHIFQDVMEQANAKWPGEINAFDMALALSDACLDYSDWYGIARRHAKDISKANNITRPVKVVRLHG